MQHRRTGQQHSGIAIKLAHRRGNRVETVVVDPGQTPLMLQHRCRQAGRFGLPPRDLHQAEIVFYPIIGAQRALDSSRRQKRRFTQMLNDLRFPRHRDPPPFRRSFTEAG